MEEAPKTLGTRELLDNVASNLYRHRISGVYYGRKKIAGKIKDRALETSDRKVADGKLRTWLDSLAHIDQQNANWSLATLLDKYAAVRANIAPSTKVGEDGRMKLFREQFSRPMTTLVARVIVADLGIWMARVSVDEDGKKKRSSTINQYRAFLRAIFAFAVANNVIAKSPFDPAVVRKEKRQTVLRRIPSDEEFAKIISEIRQPSWKAVKGKHGGQRRLFYHESADFAEYLGLASIGQAEAVNLHWEDINFASGTIHYRRQKTQRPFDTPIFPWLRTLLEKRRAAAGKAPHGRVFKIKNVRNALKSACRRAGLPHFSQRNLRAMGIRRLWEAGTDVKVIAKWQGHNDGGKLIMTIYTEVFGSSSESYERQQMEKAAKVFAKKGIQVTKPQRAAA
jgi:integrase